MIFSLTIAGSGKLLKAGTLSISETTNRRCTASFRLDSQDRSYRPAEGAEVVMTEDGTRIFAGLVDAPSERGFAGPRRPGISTSVNVIDFTTYAERRFVSETLAAGTLKSMLTTLVTNYLSVYGITLDAGQVDGPALPDLVYTDKRLDIVMNELMTLTASAGQPFIWEIDYVKVLRAYQATTDAAPFDLIGDTLPAVVGDLDVQTARSDEYANRIILRVAPNTQIEREETFVSGVDAYPYVPRYTPLKTYGYVTHETIFETLRIPPDPDVASWTWDPVAGTLTRDAGAPTAGQVTIFKFDGTFTGRWIAEDAAEIAAVGLWERVLALDSIPNEETGAAFAAAELAKRIAPIITVHYTTWEQGLTIGQQQTITVPSRNVDGSAVIVGLETRDLVHRLERSVTAVIDPTQTNLDRSFQADYETWYGAKTGGGGTATMTVGAGGGGTSLGPGNPNQSVQFNNSGAFGGDAAFLYNAATNSLICGGGGSDITAADHESCQVFGSNCHVADP